MPGDPVDFSDVGKKIEGPQSTRTRKQFPGKSSAQDPKEKYDRHGNVLEYDDSGKLIQKEGLGGSLLTQEMIDAGYTADERGIISGPRSKNEPRKESRYIEKIPSPRWKPRRK